MNDDILTRRFTYARESLDEASAAADPFVQFGHWIGEALATPAIVEPNAMTLATAVDGRPSARIVLLRRWDERGFVFFTNYESRKGREIAATPYAALLFWWSALERQVRIEGAVDRIDAAESDAYFATRPRGHQLSAWASPQSTPVADQSVLTSAMRAAEERFPGEVVRPPHWGGYRVDPEHFEFWQGRPNRVHDRLVYRREASGWEIARLAP
ncbi:MAG TPA: pyridoxamine 5'-phosphate oxidase [Candidatus Elarobacter sp.]|jgi:pyridoxamine 5'-phosphate oxidase